MKHIFLTFVICCCCLKVVAQYTVSIDSLFQYCHSHFHFNGVVLVAKQNKVIYGNFFGKANEERNIYNTPDTKFRLGSLSKQFTAFIVLQFIEKGLLSFDDPIEKFIGVLNRSDKHNITIRNLLTHTSGFEDYTVLKDFDDQLYYSKDSIVNMIAKTPLSFKPSSRYLYSNSNYFLLAMIIEKLSGKRLADVLQDMILDKAGMQSSGEDIGNADSNEATGYLYKNNTTVNAPYIEMKNTEGGGGMYSTAKDLLKWSLYFQQQLTTDKLIKTTLVPYRLSNKTKSIYSCGWCFLPGVIFHEGHINGFANLLAIDTVQHVTIIILTNQDYKQLHITMQSIQNIVKMRGDAITWMTNTYNHELKDYTGNYSDGNIKVNIKDTANCLEGNAFGKKQLLYWYDTDEFFFISQDGVIKFERNNKGQVIALHSFQDYNWVQLKKE